jgi:hypothetical protein
MSNNEEIKRIIINLNGAKCSGCDEYLGEDEVGEHCEKCEKDLDEEEKCEKCGGTHCLTNDEPCDETCPKNCCNSAEAGK